jgi:hypothetical protein
VIRRLGEWVDGLPAGDVALFLAAVGVVVIVVRLALAWRGPRQRFRRHWLAAEEGSIRTGPRRVLVIVFVVLAGFLVLLLLVLAGCVSLRPGELSMSGSSAKPAARPTAAAVPSPSDPLHSRRG